MTEFNGNEIHPGPLRQLATEFEAQLELGRRNHTEAAVHALDLLNAPSLLIDGVQGSSELGVLALRSRESAHMNRRIQNFRRYMDFHTTPLSAAMQGQVVVNTDALRETCLMWFGVEELLRSVARLHFARQPFNVASYQEWQRSIVMPQLRLHTEGPLPPRASGMTQYEANYYDNLRPLAYATGVASLVLEGELTRLAEVGEQSFAPEVAVSIRQYYVRRFIKVAQDEVAWTQAGTSLELQAHAFAFDEESLRHIHAQFRT